MGTFSWRDHSMVRNNLLPSCGNIWVGVLKNNSVR